MRIHRSIARPAALVATALVLSLGAHAALAGVPDPKVCSTIPGHINLVGASPSGIDPRGEFEIVIKDPACSRLPGSIVVVEFLPAGDLRLAAGPVDPGAIVDCPTRTIRRVTDTNGIARFQIVGGSTSGAPSGFAPNVRIFADGYYLGTIKAGLFDLDGSGGVGGADLAMWIDDFGSSSNPNRSDYDGSDFVGGADLAMWLDVFGASGSTQSGTGYCP